MEDYLARFLQYIHQRNSGSAHTLDAYRRDIEQFLLFCMQRGSSRWRMWTGSS